MSILKKKKYPNFKTWNCFYICSASVFNTFTAVIFELCIVKYVLDFLLLNLLLAPS